MIRAMIAGLGLVLGLGLTAGSALAADCTVPALQAYRAAQKSGFTFACQAPSMTSASFTTDRLRGAIGCDAHITSRFTDQSKIYKFEAKFFGSYKREVPELKNGWELASYTVEGGYYDTTLPADVGLIRYYFYMGEGEQSAQRWLTKVTLRKEGGDCKAALKEAFESRRAALP